jgi:hypothetical protein
MDAMLSVVDAALENPRIPAWFTVFGQFVAHDITYDQSALAHRAIASELRNFRAPRLDLESLCGAGPIGAAFLYDAEDPDKLLLGTNPAGELHDLPRNSQGRALVGDPRNDVHLIISQMHLAFLKFHNRVVDWLREAYDGAQTIHDDRPARLRGYPDWSSVKRGSRAGESPVLVAVHRRSCLALETFDILRASRSAPG